MKHALLSITLTLTVLFSFSQTISTTLFGQNAWMPSWAYNGKLDAIWQKAAPANFEIIRIGGIDYEDNFDEHIDDFMRFIDSIKFTCGAEPILQIPRNYSAEQTTALYQLINVTNTKDVKYWSIGNEPDYHLPNTLAEISDYFVRIAKALKDQNDSLVVIGPDYANYWVHPGDEWDAGKTVYKDFINSVGLEMNSDSTAYLLDVFSFHNYVGYTIDANIDNQDIKRVLTNINIALNQINSTRIVGLANKASWGIGEFNINQTISDNTKPWSFYNGQYLAMIYGLGMEKGATFICPWSLIEGEYRKSTDLSMFENEANDFTPRSSFWHVKMLSDNRRANFMKSTSSQKLVKTIAMKDETGSTLMILNTDETNGYATQIKLNTKITTSDDLNVNIDAGFDMEYRDLIPPNSTVTIVFDATGQFISKTLYTKEDADNFNAPQLANLVPTKIRPLEEQSPAPYFQNETNTLIFDQPLNNEFKEVRIIDVSGKVIFQKTTSQNSIQLNDLKKGIYVVSIQSTLQTRNSKFVKP